MTRILARLIIARALCHERMEPRMNNTIWSAVGVLLIILLLILIVPHFH